MTSRLTHEASVARSEDMRRHAARVRAGRARPTRHAPAAETTQAIEIRRATVADRAAIERLAELDSTAAPHGES